VSLSAEHRAVALNPIPHLHNIQYTANQGAERWMLRCS